MAPLAPPLQGPARGNYGCARSSRVRWMTLAQDLRTLKTNKDYLPN